MSGQGGWKYALEELGELCVSIVTCHMLIPELYADNWGMKSIYKELVSLHEITGLYA